MGGAAPQDSPAQGKRVRVVRTVRGRASLQILDVKGRNHWGDSDAYG